MRILAVETSGRHGSVAALDGRSGEAALVDEIALRGEQRTAQSLAPTLKDLLSRVRWSPQSVELVAVAVGPGSFTGLRIGVTTAKAFAYAVGAQVLGVNTLEVLASQVTAKAPQARRSLWTILDAQRGELFAGHFRSGQNTAPTHDRDTKLLTADDWLAGLQSGDYVAGPPLRTLRSRLPANVECAPDDLWQPMAAAVGTVAWSAFQQGQRDDLWKLVPNYYRQSAAEEKLRAKAKSASGILP